MTDACRNILLFKVKREGGRNGNIGRLGVEKAVWMGRWKETCSSECKAVLY